MEGELAKCELDMDADLHGANLVDANLQGAGLRYADLEDANLRYANLRATRLLKTDLRHASITGVCLYGTARDNWKIDGIKCDYVFWDDNSISKEQ